MKKSPRVVFGGDLTRGIIILRCSSLFAFFFFIFLETPQYTCTYAQTVTWQAYHQLEFVIPV